MPKLSSVLLVDDDPITNFLTQSLLTRLGVTERVVVAHDGAQALAHLQEHCPLPTAACPALILLDMNMPGMNGIDFLAAYQQLPEAQRAVTVVVMLTTSLHPRDVARVQEFPVADFLTKPLNEQMVDALLRQHFNWHQ